MWHVERIVDGEAAVHKFCTKEEALDFVMDIAENCVVTEQISLPKFVEGE